MRRPRHNRDLAAFLLIVVLLQFGYPVSLYGPWWNGCYLLLYAGMLVFGIRALRQQGHRTLPVYVLAVPFVAFGLWTGIDDDNPTARLGTLLLVAALQLVLMASLLRFVFRGRSTPGPQLILPAISVYLLLGGFFANISAALELLAPGSYDAAGTEATLPWQTLLYYSYVTMLTVGFGDIVPVTPWARSLAAFAAVTATLFLTLVIARLAGAYLSTPSDHHPHHHDAP